MVKKTFFAALLTLLAGLSACSKDEVHGSGVAGSETRTVGAFSEVEVHGAIRLEIGLKKDPSVTVRGDDNLVPRVTTKLDGARLIIETDKPVDSDLPLVVSITAADLTRVVAEGATKAVIEGVDNEHFEARASGAAGITVKGKTSIFEAEVSGAGSLDASGLDAQKVKAEVSGAGSADVVAHEELDARISGAGRVVYAGDPKSVKKELDGAASLSKK